MEEGSLHSEVFDSLDYLIPPIRKAYGTLERDRLFKRDFRNKLTRQFKKDTGSHQDVHATSSVILKRTTKKYIHEQYSILDLKGHLQDISDNYSPIHKEYDKKYLIEENPIIKITVIPKVTETQTSKVFNKRRYKLKKIQSTVSNDQNFIKTKNVRLMVKGKKREKVYEIKTTESTDLSNQHFNSKYEGLSIQQISDSKKLIESLNMEKKKKKEKFIGRPLINERTDYRYKHGQVHPKNINRSESNKRLNDHTSRVTIVGQVGLTQDDQYVLKCAATVNNNPIVTDFGGLYDDTRKDFLSSSKDVKPFSSTFKTTGPHLDDGNNYKRFRQQDSNIQTDIWYANECPKMISQAIQVDFNYLRNKNLKAPKNQIAQCDCSNAIMDTNIMDNVVELKKYNNPIVIISVYPRHEKEGNVDNTVQIIDHQSCIQNKMTTNKNDIPTESKRQQRNETLKLKAEKKTFRTRSPSPPNKYLVNRPVVRNIVKQNNPFDNRRPQTRTRFNKSAHEIKNPKKDVSCYCPITTCLRKEELSKKQINPLHSANDANVKQVKRDLVNNFLKSVDKIDHSDKKMKPPKGSKSRVAINLDGNEEHYDVLFEQRDLNTGITIRKTLKNQHKAEVDTQFEENFLTLSNKKRAMDKGAIYSPKSHEVSPLLPTESRLNVRDSLEIFHSRDDRIGSRLKHTPKSGRKSNSTGPIKHYPGDDCSLADPNERDKEIRELLGVMRNNPKDATQEGYKDSVQRNLKDKGCCCRTKCSSKGLMTGLNMSKFFTSKSLKQKNKIHRGSTESKKSETEAVKDCKSAKSHSFQETTTQKILKVCHTSNKEEYPFDIENKQNIEKHKIISHTKQHDGRKADNNVPIEMLILNKEENPSSTDDAHKRKEPVIEQNLILNRNIQVFLQIEQFTKQRPIMLTRKQYDKVKKTMQRTISRKLSIERRKRCGLKNCNAVSVGEIKVKPKVHLINNYDREVQTYRSEIKKTVRCIQIQTQSNYKCRKTKDTNIKENETEGKSRDKPYNNNYSKNELSSNKYPVEKQLKSNVSTRNTVSSMEIRYANIAYIKNIAVSSTNFGDGLHNKLGGSHFNRDQKASNSIHTIFKGHRKSPTPNLGTSAYSLCSNVTISDALERSVKAPPGAGDSKPKRPFLRRLISCLVMRPAEASFFKVSPVRKQPSLNTSVDSYRISTSLGALEMTSSLYDTSASFHSNHTTVPLNKMKRSFFSSVRGFLTSRRS